MSSTAEFVAKPNTFAVPSAEPASDIKTKDEPKNVFVLIDNTVFADASQRDDILHSVPLDYEEFEYQELYNPASLPEKSDFDFGRLREWFTRKQVYIQLTSEEINISHSQFTLTCNLEDVGVIKTTMVRESSDTESLCGIYFYGMAVYVKNKPLLELPVVFLYDANKHLVCKWRALIACAARDKIMRLQNSGGNAAVAGGYWSCDPIFAADNISTFGGWSCPGEKANNKICSVYGYQALSLPRPENVGDSPLLRQRTYVNAWKSVSGPTINEVCDAEDMPVPNDENEKQIMVMVSAQRRVMYKDVGETAAKIDAVSEVTAYEIQDAAPVVNTESNNSVNSENKVETRRTGKLRRLLCVLFPCMFVSS